MSGRLLIIFLDADSESGIKKSPSRQVFEKISVQESKIRVFYILVSVKNEGEEIEPSALT